MKYHSALILSLLLITATIYASGTPNLPRNFNIRGREISRKDLQYGQKLFKERKLVGKGGKACAECHNKPHKLQRKSLNKQIQKLPDLINRCLKHPERSRGQALGKDCREMRALEAWLVYRYRLKLPKE